MPATTTNVVVNMPLPNGETAPVRFSKRVNGDKTYVRVRTRGFPKLFIAPTAEGAIGYFAGQRRTPLVTAKGEKSAFVQMVEAAWGNAPKAKTGKAKVVAAPAKTAKKVVRAAAPAPKGKAAKAAPQKAAPRKTGKAIDFSTLDRDDDGFPEV